MEAQQIPSFFSQHRVIPVATFSDVAQAVIAAKHLLEKDIGCIEVTLRTPQAMDAIAAISQQVPEMMVGAGTVTRPEQVTQLVDLDVKFAVSPGFSPRLAKACATHQLIYLPGVMTPSEVMQAIDHSFTHLKFFPAEKAGGIKTLKMFGDLFPDIKFCATGGINADNMNDYLAVDNIFAVGGSWLLEQ